MELAERLATSLVKSLALSEACVDLFTYLFRAIEHGHLAIKVDSKTLSPPIEQLFDLNSESLEKFASAIKEGYAALDPEKLKESVHIEDQYLMLQKHFDLQKSIQQTMQRLVDRKLDFITGELDLDEEKKRGLELFKQKSVLFLSGFPGSGKTWLAGQMVRLIAEQKKAFVYLLAPTGLAAALLKSSIQKALPSSEKKQLKISAGTLHRFVPKEPKKIKIYADLVIVDEASMIDARLFDQLLQSIGPKTKLVLMGDPMQLPSVESGAIFNDLIKQFAENHVHLHRVYRQEGKEILSFSKAIWNQDHPSYLQFFEQGQDVVYQNESDPVEAYKNDLESDFSTPFAAMQRLHQSKILTSIQGGFLGVKQINQRLYQSLCESGKKELFVPIMVTKNQPTIDLYNGDLGIVKVEKRKGFQLLEGEAYFWSTDQAKLIQRPMHEVKSFDLGFATTIHKSQGSEFDTVYLILSDGSERFGRQILYTAVTRAKKKLYLFGSYQNYQAIFQKDTFRLSRLQSL